MQQQVSQQQPFGCDLEIAKHCLQQEQRQQQSGILLTTEELEVEISILNSFDSILVVVVVVVVVVVLTGLRSPG
jgi:hypothetical protein